MPSMGTWLSAQRTRNDTKRQRARASAACCLTEPVPYSLYLENVARGCWISGPESVAKQLRRLYCSLPAWRICSIGSQLSISLYICLRDSMVNSNLEILRVALPFKLDSSAIAMRSGNSKATSTMPKHVDT